MTMLERVARAIVEDNHAHNAVVVPWDKQPELGKRMAMSAARAVMAELRIPTDEMTEAGVTEADYAPNAASMGRIWQAMIDAAATEPKT